MLEVLVDLLERAQQPLACLTIEALDSKPQLLDRFDEVITFLGQRGMLTLHLAQLLFGTEIDRAQTLPLAPQTFEPLLDFGEIGQRIGRSDFGQLGHRGWLDLQHVADLATDVAEPAFGSLETLFGAGELLAGCAGGLQRRTRIAVGLRQRVFRFLQAVGATTSRRFRGLDFVDQRTSFFGKNFRRILELRAIALRFDGALLERGDLVSRTLLALDPA